MDSFRGSVNDLAKACARSADAAEWAELLRRCVPLVSLVALRACRLWMKRTEPAMVDDIVQEVFLKLCDQERRILRNFEPRGEDSFLGLLRVVAASVGNDYFRRHSSVKRGGKVVTSTLDDELTPNRTANAGQMEQKVLFSQLDQKLRSAQGVLGERDRVLFWLYYRQGFTAEEIAALPGTGLTAKGVESALRRIANWLREQLEASRREAQSELGGRQKQFRERNVVSKSDKQ
jgi:RNA polymerase sigma-70 factor (ECF subfamily)